jgi:AcrR family transcriptional regulator
MTLAAKAPDERRRRILAAAIAVLRDRGFSGTRVADIAATAGTSPALVLYHFSSLADVLVAALESVEADFYAELARHDDDPRRRLARMATLSVESGQAFGDWQLWLEVWVRSIHDERIDSLRRASDERWRGAIADLIDDGVTKGIFTASDPKRSTIRIACLMDGLAVQAVLGGAGLGPVDMAREWLTGAANELGVQPAELVAEAEELR